jgi:hypothetical protein
MRKILAIMVFHKFDNSCLYLTLPQIYESQDSEVMRNATVLDVLGKVERKLIEVGSLPNLTADCTNRHPWGKICIKVNRIVNFPYQGTVLIRFTL